MKKLLILFFAAGVLLFTACNKDKQKDVIQESPLESTLVFTIEQTDLDFKTDGLPECIEVPLSYVKFTVVDTDDVTTEYKSNIIPVDGELLTQVIKLLPGDYTVTSFLVYNDNGTPANEDDDILVRAAPMATSIYYDLMEYKLDLDFTVVKFQKNEYVIDVLCFEPLFYDDFGFTWFEFNDVRIERQCFFGDICTGKLQDFRDTEYMESPYEEQMYGVQMDMPAIFQMEVFKTVMVDGQETLELLRTFNNMSYINDNGEEIFYYGEGQCLEVYWPNRLDEEEEFTFVLSVMLPSGPIFEYRHLYTWTFLDDNCPDPGEDGVVDFVLGSCQYEDSDLRLPFWMDLPQFDFNMHTGNSAPGSMGTYFDVTFSGIDPDEFDIKNGTYGVWCGDKSNSIDANTTYTVRAYNSLAPATWPVGLTIDEAKIQKLNFFFNKLPLLIPGFEYDNTIDHWVQIQNVIWKITNDWPIVPGSPAETYYNYVMANHVGYEVPPGGWAAILFWKNPEVQLVFVVVDP